MTRAQPAASSAPKTFRSDAAFVYGGYFLRYLQLIVLMPLYTHILGPAGFGELVVAQSLLNIIWTVMTYGFATPGARDLAISNDPLERDRVISRQIWARIALIPLGLAVGVGFVILSPELRGNKLLGGLAIVIGIINAFNFGWAFQGLRKFKTSMALEGLAYLMTMAFGLLLVHKSTDAPFALIGMLASSLICTLISFSIILRHARMRFVPVSSLGREVKVATPFFLQSVSTQLMTSGATYLLGVLSTKEQVGLFGSSERVSALALSMLLPAAQILVPTLSRLQVDNPHAADSLARKGLFWEIVYGFAVLIGGVTLSPLVLPFVFGQKFAGGVIVFQILCAMMPFSCISHALSLYVFVPNHKERYVTFAVAISMATTIGLGFAFAPSWGGVGMALARIIGEVASAGLLAIAAWRMGLMGRRRSPPPTQPEPNR